MNNDPYDLQRFVDAQAPLHAQVCAELALGRKASHWMWFVFPQLAGLGSSAMSQRYALANEDEASAYLDHPTLGVWLRDCTSIVVGLPNGSATTLFGAPDDLKFRSSMTLFSQVCDEPLFKAALTRFYGGEPDPATVRLLRKHRADHAADSDK